MKIITAPHLSDDVDVLFLALFENGPYQVFSPSLSDEIGSAIKQERFNWKFGSILCSKVSDLPYNRIILISLGSRQDFTIERLRKVVGKAIKEAKGSKMTSLSSNIANLSSEVLPPEDVLRACTEAAILSNYSFSKYLSSDRRPADIEILKLQWGENNKLAQAVITQGTIIAQAANYAKDLTNEPACTMTPSEIEKAARTLSSIHKLKMTVLGQNEMKKEGLGALLGVAQGSAQPPKLIFLEYKGAGSKPPYAIIGKGITFDSGGYNLKPTGYMEDMKSDMAGAAAVLGTIKAVCELRLKVNIVGVMPACENMVSGSAQRPGDIVKAFNGKTIEITNTDAEGRLILADAISYTESKYKPSAIVDLATLTGAVVVALGSVCAGIMGRNGQLIADLISAGERSGDRLWQLPFFEEYQDSMDGTITDLRNTSGKGKGNEAGSITGGVFISKFVESTSWAHIDIGGTAHLAEANSYHQKGATGFGVRLLSYYFMRK